MRVNLKSLFNALAQMTGWGGAGMVGMTADPKEARLTVDGQFLHDFRQGRAISGEVRYKLLLDLGAVGGGPGAVSSSEEYLEPPLEQEEGGPEMGMETGRILVSGELHLKYSPATFVDSEGAPEGDESRSSLRSSST